MVSPLRLLLAEDSEDDAFLLVRTLRQGGFELFHQRVDTAEALTRALAREKWDLVISDYNMPSFSGLDALHIVRDHDKHIPFLFVSGSIGEETAVAAMRAGAQDYVMKNNLHRLVPAVQRELADYRERQRLEQQFLQAQKMEAVGQLAGGIAHDFNNLLTVIKSYTEFLLEDLQGDPRSDEVQQIRAAADAATALSRQLLIFSRNRVLAPQVVALNDIASGAARMLKRVLGPGVELVVSLDEHAGMIEVDPGLIEQVVLNLAINARDAMPSGGKLVIETRNTYDHGRRVTLAVSDNGMGMDAATQARMFEPFFTTKEPGKGTGLGLAMVYNVVQQYSGLLHVYSEPGIGTTFKIHFPRVDTSSHKPTPVAVPIESFRGTETVLVVEDAAAVRAVARQVLERCGYTVLEAPNGATALHLAARYHGPIDLLLTDVVMPGMSGRHLAERFRTVRASAKVLFASGYTDDAAQHLDVVDSNVPYLQKPFTPEALLRKVRQALGGTPRHDEQAYVSA